MTTEFLDYVGKLKVYNYEFSTDGPAHNLIFYCKLTFQDKITTGKGSSKKIARHEASLNMMKIIESESKEQKTSPQECKDDLIDLNQTGVNLKELSQHVMRSILNLNELSSNLNDLSKCLIKLSDDKNYDRNNNNSVCTTTVAKTILYDRILGEIISDLFLH